MVARSSKAKRVKKIMYTPNKTQRVFRKCSTRMQIRECKSNRIERRARKKNRQRNSRVKTMNERRAQNVGKKSKHENQTNQGKACMCVYMPMSVQDNFLCISASQKSNPFLMPFQCNFFFLFCCFSMVLLFLEEKGIFQWSGE